ncbi:hypothetical protein ACFFRR_000308 [Megaselia abdita]
MTSIERLEELIILNLGDLKQGEQLWKIGISDISGRGVFATRNIKCGEVIFEEAPLLIGPASRNEDTLSNCCICYSSVAVLCDDGCGLPVCGLCSDRHKSECVLFKSWEPTEPQTLNKCRLRFLTAARSITLSSNQKEVLYAMQANVDKPFQKEFENAMACFRKLLDKNNIDHLYRTMAVLNTNSFVVNSESPCPLRALYPLGGMVNNECVPNSTYTFEKKNYNMILKAAKDIIKGEEITNSYTKLLWSNLMRRLYLKITKHFICKCKRCLDSTEGGSLLSALYCKADDCSGLVVPEASTSLHPDWKCLKCETNYPHVAMSKKLNILLKSMDSKLNTSSLAEAIDFIVDKCPLLVPESNQIIVEAKYNIVSRINSSDEGIHLEILDVSRRFCEELLTILDKLGVGASEIRTYLENQKKRERQ